MEFPLLVKLSVIQEILLLHCANVSANMNTVNFRKIINVLNNSVIY